MFSAMKSWLLPVVVCVVALGSAVAARTARFTAINYPRAVNTWVFGVNPAGDLVGAYDDAATPSHQHAFALRNGQFTSFDWPGSTWTDAYGINPRGDIVGQYGWFEPATVDHPAGVSTVHGFLLRDGVLSAIDVLDQPNTMPVKISPEGTIVGCYHVGIDSGATILDTMFGFALDADGAVSSHPMNRTMNNGVNPSGDIVGTYFSTTSGRAEESYVLRNGQLSWFHFPGSVVTQAIDISPSGTIVGWHRTSLTGPLPQFHGFIMDGDEMTSFDVPGATETRAYGVSATGDVVGYYRDAAGVHGFVVARQGLK